MPIGTLAIAWISSQQPLTQIDKQLAKLLHVNFKIDFYCPSIVRIIVVDGWQRGLMYPLAIGFIDQYGYRYIDIDIHLAVPCKIISDNPKKVSYIYCK